MNFQQIETFYWAAQLGSISAAAERVHTSQSSATMRIQELENLLDVTLFDRSARSATLTSKGRELLAYAERILTAKNDFEAFCIAKDQISGLVRIGVSELVANSWLPKLIREIQERYPKITLELDCDSGEYLMKRFEAGKLDLILFPELFLSEFSVPSEITTYSLGSTPVYWMASSKREMPSSPIGPEELASMPILASATDSQHYKSVKDWFRKRNTKLDRLSSCANLLLLTKLVIEDVGVSLLPYYLAKQHVENGVLQILSEPIGKLNLVVVFSRASAHSVVGVVAKLASELSEFDKQSSMESIPKGGSI